MRELAVETTPRRLHHMMIWARENRIPVVCHWLIVQTDGYGGHIGEEREFAGTRRHSRSALYPTFDRDELDDRHPFFLLVRDRDYEIVRMAV